MRRGTAPLSARAMANQGPAHGARERRSSSPCRRCGGRTTLRLPHSGRLSQCGCSCTCARPRTYRGPSTGCEHAPARQDSQCQRGSGSRRAAGLHSRRGRCWPSSHPEGSESNSEPAGPVRPSRPQQTTPQSRCKSRAARTRRPCTRSTTLEAALRPSARHCRKRRQTQRQLQKSQVVACA